MKILDIAVKDLIQSLRSTFTIGMTVVAPLLITGLMYFAFSGMGSGGGDLPDISVGIVNLDSLPAASPLQVSLGESIRSMFFDPSVNSWIHATDYPDPAAARAAVDRQEIGVAVLIPQDFTANFMDSNGSAVLTLVQDPTLSITPRIVEDMLTSLLDGFSGGGIAYTTFNERAQTLGLSLDPSQLPQLLEQYQSWYIDFQRNLFHNPQQAVLVQRDPSAEMTSGGNAPGGMADLMGAVLSGQMIFFSFYSGAFAMMSILKEQEEGTLARLFTTPTDRTNILAGKFLAVLLTVILQGLVMILIGRLAFGVNWGQPAGWLLALLAQVLATTGLGVLLIAFVRDSRQGGPVLGGGLTALGMLGGLFTVAIPNMPEAFKALANFTPQGWVLKTWRLALDGAPPAEMILPFLVCAALGVVMFAAGAVLFRRRFA